MHRSPKKYRLSSKDLMFSCETRKQPILRHSPYRTLFSGTCLAQTGEGLSTPKRVMWDPFSECMAGQKQKNMLHNTMMDGRKQADISTKPLS